MKPTARLIVLVFAIAAQAQDLSNFTKLLVPVLNMNPITGANGSKFSTTFGLFAYGRTVSYYPTGASSEAPVVGKTLANGRMLYVPAWEAPVVAKGRFVFVQPDAENLPFFETLRATAPDGSIATTPLPIVRNRDTTTGISTFIDVPVTPMYGPLDPAAPHGTGPFLGYAERQTLRIYDFDSTGRLEVNVRLYWGTSLDLGVREEHRISVSQRDAADPSYPFYAEVNLGGLFQNHWCYPSTPQPCGSFPAIIEVEPLTPGIPYYAFISTTDNQTNHVAVFTRREQ